MEGESCISADWQSNVAVQRWQINLATLQAEANNLLQQCC